MEVLLPVRPKRNERDEVDFHLAQIELLGHSHRALRCRTVDTPRTRTSGWNLSPGTHHIALSINVVELWRLC